MPRFVAFAFLALLAGCAAGSNLPPLPPVADQSIKLASNDRVKITVFGADDLSGEFQVNDAGNVALPLIGPLHAAGMDVPEVAQAVETKLKNGYVRDPKVAVQLLASRPIYVYGEVTRPGEYVFSSGETVLAAISQAGGYSYRANQGSVIVVREGKQYAGEPMSKLQPGDIVQVTERLF